MYEELLSDEEIQRSVELQDMFVVLSAFRAIYRNIDYRYPGDSGNRVDRPYISSQEERMSVQEIKDFLLKSRLPPNGFSLESIQPENIACAS
jgi:hypothetical protein